MTLYRGNSQRPASDVVIDWTGRVICPTHGALPATAEYAAGRAVCGCMFVLMPDGLLRAEIAHNSQLCNTANSPLATQG
jgi:hypothetical protein